MSTKILGLATCFNRRQKTLGAIEALRSGNPSLCFDFIITDDHSTDGTPEALAQLEGVTVLHGDGSLYYSGGMRKAIAEAKTRSGYDYCLLFNDDVEFYEHSIEYLVSLNQNTVWVGPTCDEQGKLVYSGINRKSGFVPKYTHLIADSREGLPCETLNANCVLIPWHIFIDLDNIPEVYRHSFGDYDYGFMITRKGYSLRVPDRFVGMCKDDTKKEGSWKDTSLPLKQRIALKESVKGLPFREYFFYLNRNFSLPTAVVYSLTPYIRMILRRN